MLETQVRKHPSSRGQPAAAQVGFTSGFGHLLVLLWMGLAMDWPWRTDPSILHPKKNLTTPVNIENIPSLSPEGLTLVFKFTFPCLPSIILLLQLKSGIFFNQTWYFKTKTVTAQFFNKPHRYGSFNPL